MLYEKLFSAICHVFAPFHSERSKKKFGIKQNKQSWQRQQQQKDERQALSEKENENYLPCATNHVKSTFNIRI